MFLKKETLTIEFKSDKKKYPELEIFDAVVTFQNIRRRFISWNRGFGEVTGVHPMHENPITLSRYIANDTIPQTLYDRDYIDKLPVLKISVPKSLNGIVWTNNAKVFIK